MLTAERDRRLCMDKHENTKHTITTRVEQGPQIFFGTHGNQLPSLSGVHGFKDFLYSAYLVGSFDGQIYSLKQFHTCKFIHQRIQEDEHYRANP